MMDCIIIILNNNNNNYYYTVHCQLGYDSEVCSMNGKALAEIHYCQGNGNRHKTTFG